MDPIAFSDRVNHVVFLFFFSHTHTPLYVTIAAEEELQ